MVTFFVIMSITIIGIILRILGEPLSGLTNLSESLLIIAVYCGIAYAQQVKQHVAVEFFISRLSKTPQKILNMINLIIPFGICTILIFICWDFALESWQLREKMDGAPFYPIYPPKIAIAVGISLLWLQLLADLLREIMLSVKSTIDY
jgi:TRAP-type C4-dicarboxylate transport system permease small subunit